ncbi:RNA polymerase primary sigma factor [Thermocatellispora tengchongensis]|uniref:RNA polymerase sigma factor n=1 Tax=Thermocatellispora tengchongensis TaxID=1073253 RepID=A0A840P4T1_9ACTN|nr:RNA polymerase sigma factor [Thermocatellispora tengchongensis]MBB5134362.1 RNA polymerase primary sigma factor [Thermocatellispora tengchongensis]
MPRTAVATPPAGSATTLDRLLDRGRAQGHLSLAELRHAFAEAGLTPTEGRSILRELTEAGVSLGADEEPALGARPRKKATTTSTRSARGKGTSSRRAKANAAKAESPAPKPAAPAEGRKAAGEPTGPAESPEPAEDWLDAEPEELDEAAEEAALPNLPADPAHTAGSTQDAEDDAADAEHGDSEQLDLDDQSSVMGDSVHTYLKSIGRRSLLTAAQEVELAKRIEAGLYAEHKLETEPNLPDDLRVELEWVARDGKQAKDHMLEANLRLVVSVAKKYTDRGMALLDVVQEGNLGLIRAVEKFDYTKGYKFSTYAMWWIRQAIQRGFADSARTIRLPVHVLEMLSKLSRVERDMHQRLGREPTPEELAVELDKTPDQIEELLRTSRQPLSLNATIGDDGETTIGDLIEDADSLEASELVDRQLLADQLRGVLGNLSPREAKIMALRFGLIDGKPHTLDEIGKHLGLTRERIRQLEKESLSKLRHPSNTRPLLDWAS